MRVPPALLTRMSIRPSSEVVCSISATTASSTFTSVGTARHLREVAARIAAAVVSRSVTVRAAMTTSAPCSARSIAVAAPMPVPPPVTTATLPVRS